MATKEGKTIYTADKTVLGACPGTKILALVSVVTSQMALRMKAACRACMALCHGPDDRSQVGSDLGGDGEQPLSTAGVGA